MFESMKKRNRRRIYTPILLSLVLSFSVIASITIHSFWNSLITNTLHNISQKSTNLNLFLDLMEETSKRFDLKDINTADSNNHDQVSEMLSNLSQINKNLLGAAFIYPDGEIILSPRTSGYPTAEEIKSIPEIQQFLKSDKSSSWIIRTNYIAKYYGNKFYNKEYGVFTLVNKIKMADGGYGLLLIDIDPQTIYNIFTDNTHRELDIRVVLISSGLEILPNPGETDTIDLLGQFIRDNYSPEKYKLSFRHRKLIFYTPVSENYKIATLVSVDILFLQLAGILIPLLLVLIIFVALSFYISHLLTKTISDPLEKLYHTMNSEQLKSSIEAEVPIHNEP
ncbi:MAG: hypothetical protein GX918_08085 [Clostridiales bacterium]|nr:hypothetical protein [Clostridiales bacterium]